MKTSVCLAVLLFSASLAAAEDAVPVRRLRVALPGTPSARYAGLYLAKEKGLYAKRGLDIEFFSYSSPRKAGQALLKGEANAAVLTFSQAQILREEKEKVKPVLLAQAFPRSSLVLVGRKADGINKPSDVEGKTVGIFEDMQVQPRAFFKKYDSNVTFVPQPYSVNPFLRGAVTVTSARRYDELYALQAAGLRMNELTVFVFDDHGIRLPEDGLYAGDSQVLKDTATACAFAEVSMQGWKAALASPEEAFRLVIKQLHEVHVTASHTRQKRMLEGVLKLLPSFGKDVKAGALSAADYAGAAALLAEAGVIKQAPPYETFVSECAR